MIHVSKTKKNGYADGYNPLSGYEEAYFTQNASEISGLFEFKRSG